MLDTIFKLAIKREKYPRSDAAESERLEIETRAA